MGLRIWETDPEAAPKPRKSFSDDLVGRFRSGYQVSRRPMALEEWRVTTGDPDVATKIIDMYGSVRGDEAQEWETSGEDNLEVFTSAKSVKVIIAGPSALRQEMVLWGTKGAIRRCDGITQHGEDAEGEGCLCPASFAERKAADTKGTGCKPNITLFFKLERAPELGLFKFTTGSWSFVRDLGPAEAKLAEIDGPVVAALGLLPVEFESAGQKRRFTKPTLDILSAYTA